MPSTVSAPPGSLDSMRESLRGFRLAGVIAFLAICATSAIFTPAAAVLVIIWAWVSRTPWRAIGLVRPDSWTNGLLIGITLGLAEKFLLKAVVLPLLGAPPVNAMFGDLAANPRHALFLVFYVVIGAGLCEEIVFRGYLFERLGKLIGESRFAQTAAVFLTTAFFAGLHYQQGVPGIENAAIGGAIAGIVYLANRRRLWTVIVMHATFDLSSVALNYFHLEAVLSRSLFG